MRLPSQLLRFSLSLCLSPTVYTCTNAGVIVRVASRRSPPRAARSARYIPAAAAAAASKAPRARDREARSHADVSLLCVRIQHIYIYVCAGGGRIHTEGYIYRRATVYRRIFISMASERCKPSKMHPITRSEYIHAAQFNGIRFRWRIAHI